MPPKRDKDDSYESNLAEQKAKKPKNKGDDFEQNKLIGKTRKKDNLGGKKSKRGRSKHVKDLNDGEMNAFYGMTMRAIGRGMYYDPATDSYKKAFSEDGQGGYKTDAKLLKMINRLSQEMGNQMTESMSNFSTNLIRQKNKRGWYSQQRNEFFAANRDAGGKEEKGGGGGAGEAKLAGPPPAAGGGAGESKFAGPPPAAGGEPVSLEGHPGLWVEVDPTQPVEVGGEYVSLFGDGKSGRRFKKFNENMSGGESKGESKMERIRREHDERMRKRAEEQAQIPGADQGNNIKLKVQEAKVEDQIPRETKVPDSGLVNPPGPIFGPEDNRPPPQRPNFNPGPDIPVAEIRPAPPAGPGVLPPIAPPAGPAIPPVAPPAGPAIPPVAAPAAPAPPGPPGGGPPGPPGPAPAAVAPNPGGPPGPVDPQLVEVNRGVPGEGSGGQMGFTSSAATRVAGERNRMKYSRERLLNEIRAFIRIYRDQIKTRSFVHLSKVASKLTKNSPAVRLRQVHRDLEEEIIDYYRSASGMRLGVILDPGALGLDVNQLQGALAPNLAFQGQGEVVRNLARAADAGRPNDPVQRAVDTHYHLGGLAHATKAVLPEGRNLQSNDRPAERIQLLRGRTRKMRVPQEATRRFLWRDTRRPVIPENIKIKSVRD